MIYLGAWNCGLPALMNSKQLICWAHYLFCFTPQYIEGKCESFALALSRSLSFVFNISILWMKFPFIKHFEFKVFCVASLFSIFDFWFLLYSWYNRVLSQSAGHLPTTLPLWYCQPCHQLFKMPYPFKKLPIFMFLVQINGYKEIYLFIFLNIIIYSYIVYKWDHSWVSW